MSDTSALEIKAWKLGPWLRSVNAARSSFYSWSEDVRPRTVPVGRNLLVVESPEAWLSRMAARAERLRANKQVRRGRVKGGDGDNPRELDARSASGSKAA